MPSEIIEEIVTQFQIFNQMVHRSVATNSSKDNKIAIFQTGASNSVVNGPGRPKLLIPEETLLHFRELGYTWIEIASLLMVSRWT